MSFSMMSSSSRASVLVGAAGVSLMTGFLVALPAGPAAAAGPQVCTATGGTTATPTIGGIRYNVVTFTATGNFNPAQTTDITYVVVGGGGGGGGATNTTGAGGGGGGADVETGSQNALTTGNKAVTIGAGGTAGNSTTRGGTGGTSSFAGTSTVQAFGGGGGGAANGGNAAARNGAQGAGAGASGGGGSGRSAAATGGIANSPGLAGGNGFTSATNGLRAGGGGGSQTLAGAAGASNVGGAGRAGVATSISGTSVTYAGGGGGGGTTAGAGGSGGGGAGGTAGNGTAGTANTGGGGGGGRSTAATTTGGAGGSGVVIIRYPRFCRNPSSPTSIAFSSPTMSWAAPTFVPSDTPITSYTVTYRQSGDTSAGNIYARGSTATSLNITGTTTSACTSNNAGWTCGSGITLVSGQTYEFRVFARTATTLGQSQQTALVTYAVP